MEWEQIFVNFVTDKGSISTIHGDLKKPINNKRNNIVNGQKTWTDKIQRRKSTLPADTHTHTKHWASLAMRERKRKMAMNFYFTPVWL